jgi:DNA helicase IV
MLTEGSSWHGRRWVCPNVVPDARSRKAKGLEFDHVIVAHCSASPFPDDLEARRLIYVALSRACRSVTLLVSGRAPSPLLP